jgi:stress response protein YsnF
VRGRVHHPASTWYRAQAGDSDERNVVPASSRARSVEELGEPERVAPNEQDSGQVETLPDGSISIPILEEELVITKRVNVRERVILRKRVSTREQLVRDELRRERVEIELTGDAPMVAAAEGSVHCK